MLNKILTFILVHAGTFHWIGCVPKHVHERAMVSIFFIPLGRLFKYGYYVIWLWRGRYHKQQQCSSRMKSLTLTYFLLLEKCKTPCKRTIFKTRRLLCCSQNYFQFVNITHFVMWPVCYTF